MTATTVICRTVAALLFMLPALAPAATARGQDDGDRRPDDVQRFRELVAARTAPRRAPARSPAYAPTKGNVTNLVLFVRFAGEPEPGAPFETFEALFDDADPALVSLRSFVVEASYGKLQIQSSFLPEPAGSTIDSFESARERSWLEPLTASNPGGYADGWAGMEREWTFVEELVGQAAAHVKPGLGLDANGDGVLDLLTIVVSGMPGQWADVLWPHFTFLEGTGQVAGLRVGGYVVLFRDRIAGWGDQAVIAHEIFHAMGFPDLYHYWDPEGRTPVGPWDLMEGEMRLMDLKPHHPLAYTKSRYGKWIDAIPSVKKSGVFRLRPLGRHAEGSALRFDPPYPSKEFFVVEYRLNTGTYEGDLPGPGLVATRIDTSLDGLGNVEGPPDEIHVLRPGWTPGDDGFIGQAALVETANRTELGPDGDVVPVHSNGKVADWLRVHSVGPPFDELVFEVCLSGKGDCDSRVCGSDGCDGSCGTCPAGTRCADDGTACVLLCEPSCIGRQCGTDGCGGSCGHCAKGEECQEGRCVRPCAGACDATGPADEGGAAEVAEAPADEPGADPGAVPEAARDEAPGGGS